MEKADKEIGIINADRFDKTRVIVDFSDGTIATFTVEQLTLMKIASRCREQTRWV